jgi:hypothetical protein
MPTESNLRYFRGLDGLAFAAQGWPGASWRWDRRRREHDAPLCSDILLAEQVERLAPQAAGPAQARSGVRRLKSCAHCREDLR